MQHRETTVLFLRIRNSQVSRQQQEEEAFVRRYTRRIWLRTWCTMLRHNVIACGRDTVEGLRDPRAQLSGRNRKSRLYPLMDDGDSSQDGGGSGGSAASCSRGEVVSKFGVAVNSL